MCPRFSQRIGQAPLEAVVQLDWMSPELRHSLWNVLLEQINSRSDMAWIEVGDEVARDFTKTPIDELPDQYWQVRDWIKQRFYNLPWAEAYDFVEFWATKLSPRLRFNQNTLINRLNQVLEREGSGYRFISGILAPISDTVEVGAIQEAALAAEARGFGGARTHLATAVDLLGKRPEPDLRNAVKEAISAVEAVVNQLAGTNASGIATGLDVLDRQKPLPGALKAAMKSLYGYTSGADGIRHAIDEESTIDFATTKFMIVACSAFINFVLAREA